MNTTTIPQFQIEKRIAELRNLAMTTAEARVQLEVKVMDLKSKEIAQSRAIERLKKNQSPLPKLF